MIAFALDLFVPFPLSPSLYTHSSQAQRILPSLFFPSDRSAFLFRLFRFLRIRIPRANARRFPERATALQQPTNEWFHQTPHRAGNNAETFSEGFANRGETGFNFVADGVSMPREKYT